MRIKNLKIDSFGKLNDVNIALDEKITVISGKNEAGKSSVATFIKYMLYGFDSSKKQDISENQKKKYMPWNGDDCSGEMIFTGADGKRYSAVRKTSTRSQNTVFDENNMPKTSENAGDYFLGVNENAYKKTAFIGQRDTAFTDDGELDSAIRNMVYSGDESVDSQKALNKLEDIKKYYLGKAGRSGEIYEIDKELETLIAERDKWKDGHKELLASEYSLAETKKRIDFNKEKKALLEREKENLEYFVAKNKLVQIEETRKSLEEGKTAFEEHYKTMQNGSFVPDAEFAGLVKAVSKNISDKEKMLEEDAKNLEKAKQNLDSVYSDEVQKNIFDTLTKNNQTSEKLLFKIENIRKKQKSAKLIAIILTCLVVTIPVAIFFYMKASSLSKQLGVISAEYGCESADLLERKLSAGTSYKNVEEAARRYLDDAKRTLEEDKNQLSEYKKTLLTFSEKAGFGVSETDEYLRKVSMWLSKNEALKTKCREDFVAYNTLCSSVNVEELEALASKYDDTIPVRDAKTVSQQLAFYTQANDALIAKERELEKQAAVLSNTLPKPSELQSRILSLTERRREMKDKHDALGVAIEALEKASENMRSEASPKIASETSNLFSKITDGKYKALYADSGMRLTFLEKDEAQVRDAGYLSAGTLDAAYISLRIALCEFLYKEHPTLIFDDAFANMDDERLHNTLDFLMEISEDFQIIILSCHDREKKYLDGKAKIIDFAI